MSLAGSAASPAQFVSPQDARLLLESLESLHGLESRLVEACFDLFFARHPDVRPLFGEHGLSEREEMMRETLVSVLGHVEGEPWLEENLEAMGKSHAEYGVEGRSYTDFVAVLLDSLEAMAPPGWSPATKAAWRRALDRITDTMRRAGDAAGAT